MATRVNKKFVVILAGSMVVLFGAVGAAGLIAMKGRAARGIAKGDALMNRGEFEEAAKVYSRSVNLDQTKQDWIEKWIAALTKSTPAVRAEYEQSYGFYRTALRQLAALRATDSEAQIRYIRELDRSIREGGNTRDSLDFLVRETEGRLTELKPEDAGTKILLRYRGLGLVDIMSLTTIDEAKRQQALSDLEAAISADPKDWESKIGVIRWHLAEGERGLREGRGDLTKGESAVATRLLDEFLAQNPGHPEGMLMAFIFKQTEIIRGGSAKFDSLKAMGDALSQEAVKVVAAAVSAPDSELRPEHIQRLAGMLSKGVGIEGAGALLELVDRTLAKYPDDAALMLSKGVLLMEKGDVKEAVVQFQRVVDLPDIPVSLEGLLMGSRRQTAVALQVDAALRQWSEADQRKDDAGKREALAAAKGFRKKLADLVGVRGREVLLLRDAKIAMAEGHFAEAVQNLSELRQTEAGTTIEALQLLAQSLEQQQNHGEARRVYLELIEKAPNLPWAHAKIGEMNLRLGNTEQARDNYAVALKLDPSNPDLRTRFENIQGALARRDSVLKPGDASAAEAGAKPGAGGAAGGGGGGDPILDAIIESRAKRIDNDEAGAVAMLEKILAEHPEDNRLIREMAQTYIQIGRREKAVALLERSAAAKPGDKALAQLLTLAQAESPVEGQLAVIAQADAPELDKALERFQVLIRAGRKDEAKAALAAAESMSRDDARVLDLLFVMALNEGDRARYMELAKRAAEQNTDQMNGLLYQARIELVEGKDREAVTTLERAVKINDFQPAVKRLLAQAYQKVGRVQDSINAYTRAYEGKPDDPATARDYALALAAANRGAEALDVISPTKGVLRFGQSDDDLIRLWLELEARYGDREAALKVRRERFAREPERLDNTMALAGLLIDAKDFTGAAAVIDAMEKGEMVDATTLAALRANIEAKRGDTKAGARILRASIDTTPEGSRTLRQHQVYAEFLIQNGMIEEGESALEEARTYQNPKLMEVDRRVGDLEFERAGALQNSKIMAQNAKEEEKASSIAAQETQHYEKALDAYRLVLKAGYDEVVAKRAAETSLRLARPDEAAGFLSEIIKDKPDDIQALALRAEIAKLKKDMREARRLMDRAVELYPSESSVFLQRGLILSEDPAALKDSLEDLQQAARLKPSMMGAWLARATILNRQGRVEEALGVIRAAADANPANDELRLMLVRELWGAGKEDQAQAELLRVAEERPDNLNWLKGAAFFMKQVGRMREAANLYEKSFAQKPEPEVAGLFLDAKLRSGETPTKREVQKYLAEFEKQEPKSIGDYMLRSRTRAFLEQMDLAKAQAAKALALVGEDSSAARYFSDELVLMLKTPDKVVEFLDAQEKSGTLPPFLRVTKIAAMLRTGKPGGELLSNLRQIEPDAKDPYTRYEMFKLIGEIAYLHKEFRQSADSYIKALEIAPESVQLNNDLAYTLGSDLHDPEAALPYALKAASLDRSSPVLDTLGWIQHQSKRFEDAEKTLTEAVTAARTPDQSLIALLHLGLTQIELGKRDEALRSMLEAEKAARANPAAAQAFKEPLEALRTATK